MKPPSTASVSNKQSDDGSLDCVQNGTSGFMEEKARPDEAASPALSHLSMKSDQSMDRPIVFSNETPSYIGLRPDEAASPVTSYFSLKSNQSMDRPIVFKDRNHPYHIERIGRDPLSFMKTNPSYGWSQDASLLAQYRT
ncbi:hypothetical protein PO909_002804, partial [Leuciscus waleckii]